MIQTIRKYSAQGPPNYANFTNIVDSNVVKIVVGFKYKKEQTRKDT